MAKVTDDFSATAEHHSNAASELLRTHELTIAYYVDLLKQTKEQAVQGKERDAFLLEKEGSARSPNLTLLRRLHCIRR